MKKFLTIENVLSLLVFCTPLYLICIDCCGIPTNIFEILAGSVFLFCLYSARKSFFLKMRSFPGEIALAVLFLLVGVFLSIMFNGNFRSGFGILKSWFLLPIFFSFLFFSFSGTTKTVEKFFLSICLSAATVGSISVAYKMLGMTTYDDRLKAFYLSPNHLAMYLACGIFFSLYFFYTSFARNDRIKIFLSSLILLLLMLPLYFTFSYGAWMAIFLSVLSMSYLTFLRKKFFYTALLLVLFFFAWIAQSDSAKFAALQNFSERSSAASRVVIWKSSLLMLQQNFLFGIGPGNFQDEYLSLQKFFPPYLEWAVPQPHNIFLAFWLQSGILGVAAFLFIIFSVFKRLFRLYGKNLLAVPLIGFFAYTLLHGMIDTTYWKNDLSFLFWLCAGIALALQNMAIETKNQA